MGLRNAPGCAYQPYDLSFFNLGSILDQYFIQVEIHTDDTAAVVQVKGIACKKMISDKHYGPVMDCLDREA
jgi:hypothetical protein